MSYTDHNKTKRISAIDCHMKILTDNEELLLILITWSAGMKEYSWCKDFIELYRSFTADAWSWRGGESKGKAYQWRKVDLFGAQLNPSKWDYFWIRFLEMISVNTDRYGHYIKTRIRALLLWLMITFERSEEPHEYTGKYCRMNDKKLAQIVVEFGRKDVNDSSEKIHVWRRFP